jgi:hypothetical protein
MSDQTNPLTETADVACSGGAHDWLQYDERTLTIDGFKFSRELFRYLTASPCGISFRIVNRDNDVITISQEIDPVASAAPALLIAAKEVMAALEKFGGSIVPHLMDTDMNAGQRLRDAIEAAERA